MNVIGWIGGALLALASVPQLIKVAREGHAEGVSMAFLASWLVGCLLSLVYVLGSGMSGSWPLIANYSINVLVALGIGYYKVRQRDPRNLIHRGPFKLTDIQKQYIIRKDGGEVG